MKKCAFLLAILLCSQLGQASVGVPVKKDVLVPNEKTAIAIAKAILAPIFGEDFNQNRVRRSLANPHIFYATPSLVSGLFLMRLQKTL